VGRAVADPVEVVEGQVDLRLVRDGEQVQDGVGGAAERHDDGDGVLERLRVMIWRAVMPWRSRLTTASPEATAKASRRLSGAGGAALPGRAIPSASATLAMVLAVYMPPQEPMPGQAAFSIGVELVSGDQPAGAGADALEDVDDREVVAVAELPGQRGAGVDEDAGQVEAGRRP
jgi:hypothetical protein